MKATELFEKVLARAKDFGLMPKNNGKTLEDAHGNAVVRNNLSTEAFHDGKAYFGFINESEEFVGRYSDFSFVIIPEAELGHAVVSFAIGSSGFKEDYPLSQEPGLRRTFMKLWDKHGYSFFKTNFDDNTSTSSELLKTIGEECAQLKAVITNYKTVLPACCIVDFTTDEEAALKTVYQWLAIYADLRDWGPAAKKKERQRVIAAIETPEPKDEEKEVSTLLRERHFVVLQGAPGTGKTFTALKIAKDYKTFFTQFHAETTYSDFVYGWEPNVNATGFRPKKGILYNAITAAQEDEHRDVLLIIDEINRANLSNVLGPVFYLFEYQADRENVSDDFGIMIGDMKVKSLPKNLYVIATMNTADRSLAVVDFALRRRFAWYTLRPHEIKVGEGKEFMKGEFKEFNDIFLRYATDEELNLQPGQAYFIVDKQNAKEQMKTRMEYELLPLIKEYLNEGFMLKAKDSFSTLFLKHTGKMLYE